MWGTLSLLLQRLRAFGVSWTLLYCRFSLYGGGAVNDVLFQLPLLLSQLSQGIQWQRNAVPILDVYRT